MGYSKVGILGLCGVVLFQLMTREESRKWFEEVVPALGSLLLRLPSLLEAHYENADKVLNVGAMIGTGLRMLDSQEAGIVFLSRVCFFCYEFM